MNKKSFFNILPITVIYSVPWFLLLGGCVDNTAPNENKEKVTQVRVIGHTIVSGTNDDDLSNISVLCIDGVQYLTRGTSGITPRYSTDGEGDPYILTCTVKEKQ